MEVNCEIKVQKCATETYRPGTVLKGLIKYNIVRDTAFKKITVSFKGNGSLIVKHKQRENNLYTHRKREEYADIDYIIYLNETADKISAGAYETEFNFVLPENLPPSFRYSTVRTKYLIKCEIMYYLRIKFEKFGIGPTPIKFKREVKIVSLISPKLQMEPTVYGESKTLTMRTMFYRQKGTIKLAAVIQKSVLNPGEKIVIDCDINNDSNVTIKGVIFRMFEIITFKSKGSSEVPITETVENTDSRSRPIYTGDTQSMNIEIVVPSNAYTMENNNLVTRDYFVLILAELPRKRCVFLKIPIQICDEIKDDEHLPTYWEALQDSQDFYHGSGSYHSSDDEMTTEL